MDFNRIILYFNTIKYLKFIQIFYRLKNIIKWLFGIKISFKKLDTEINKINLINNNNNDKSFLGNNTFTFLNQKIFFKNNIDWNYSGFGKLWTYNLNYFDFLNQNNMDKNTGTFLIKDFIDFQKLLVEGKEPYPISLRIINWIKFISIHKIDDHKINQYLFKDLQILSKNIEYHLLANHLLENGFALFFGAYYFGETSFFNKSKNILEFELNEQILKDGAHFELSTMYHSIILNRLLDCVNLESNNKIEFQKLKILKESSIKMLGWLETIKYSNGNVPNLNDSVFGIAPFSEELFKYANNLEINWSPSILCDSGYRKWNGKRYEMIIDIGQIGPDYNPGHAHADTFNFELVIDNNSFIVDPGISTYEKNINRKIERSTYYHNTVEVNGNNSSAVWGGFRVGRRARVINIIENEKQITAQHNGYSKTIHQRKFSRFDDMIIIKDKLISKNKVKSFAFLHFHPSIKSISFDESNKIHFSNLNISIKFSKKLLSLEKIKYYYCHGFNKKEDGICLKILFDKELETRIVL